MSETVWDVTKWLLLGMALIFWFSYVFVIIKMVRDGRAQKQKVLRLMEEYGNERNINN